MTKKLEDFSIFNVNPFFKDVRENEIIQSKDAKVTLPTSLTINDSSGKHVSNAFIRKNIKKFSDVREFVRIPSDGLNVIASFDKSELKIFCYIIEFLEYNVLEIELRPDKIKKHFNYVSRNPIYNGIVGLLSKGLIAKKNTTKAEYYINPMYFYKGNITKSFFDYLSESNLKMVHLSNEDLKSNTEFDKQKAIG